MIDDTKRGLSHDAASDAVFLRVFPRHDLRDMKRDDTKRGRALAMLPEAIRKKS